MLGGEMLNKYFRASVIFLLLALFFLADYSKAKAMERWGIESSGQITHVYYDCSKGVPKQKEGPSFRIEFDLAGEKRDLKTGWWVSGENGYCSLKIFSKIKITSIGVVVGGSKIISSATDYQMEQSKFGIVMFCFYLFWSVIAFYGYLVSRNNEL